MMPFIMGHKAYMIAEYQHYWQVHQYIATVMQKDSSEGGAQETPQL